AASTAAEAATAASAAVVAPTATATATAGVTAAAGGGSGRRGDARRGWGLARRAAVGGLHAGELRVQPAGHLADVAGRGAQRRVDLVDLVGDRGIVVRHRFARRGLLLLRR